MQVWVLAIADIVLSAVSLVSSIANSGSASSVSSGVVSVVLAVIAFVVANNVKKERDFVDAPKKGEGK